MATYYVSATAPGGGTGAIGSPWTLAEAIAQSLDGHTFLIASGNYSFSANQTITPTRCHWLGVGLPIITWTGGSGHALFTPNLVGGIFQNLHFKLFGGQALYSNNTQAQYIDCIFDSQSSAFARLAFGTGLNSEIRRCVFTGDHPFAPIGSLRVLGGNNLYKANVNSAGEGIDRHGMNSSVVFNYSPIRSASRSVIINTGIVGVTCNDFGDSAIVNDSIILGSYAFSAGSGETILADNVLHYTSSGEFTGLGNLVKTNVDALGADPFIDSSTLDLRLTTAAKSSAYGDRLKAIMAGLLGVPGITTDTLDELTGGAGGGSAGFTGIRGTTRTIGT